MQAQQDSFQAAIDYLLRGRRQATQQRQGLFTQAQAPAPTTNISSVVKDVFGDRYRSGGDSNSYEPPFTGNPYTGKGLFGTPTFNDVARGQARQGELERNRDNLSRAGGAIGQLFQMAVPGAMLAKYAVPYVNNLYNEYQYDRALSDYDARAAQVAATQAALGGQVGTYSDAEGNLGTISNQDMIDAYDRAVFGDSGSSYDSLSSDAVAQSLSNAGYSDTGAYGEGPGGFESRSSGGGIGVDGW